MLSRYTKAAGGRDWFFYYLASTKVALGDIEGALEILAKMDAIEL